MAFFQHRGGHYLILAAAAGLLFFWNLGTATLWDLDEGRNATCSGEMNASSATDNWITPTFNNALRVDKPVLLYWLQMIGYRVGGINEWTARLPSAFAGLFALLVAYEIARSLFSKTTALLAGLILASSPMMIGAARFANPDALLNLFNALTLLLFWRSYTRPATWCYLAMGAASGMAMLAKGPVGLVLPGAIITLFLLWERHLGYFWDRRVGWAFWMFFFVGMPWYILVAVATKLEFARGFFLKHNLERAMNPMENHSGSVLYYPLVLILGTLPWSIFAAGALWTAAWSCVRQPKPRWQTAWDRSADQAGRGGPAAYRFLGLWILVYLTVFSISATKLPNYVLPVVLPWSILTARLLDRWRRRMLELPTWWMRMSVASLVLFGVGLGASVALAGGVGEASFLRGRFFPGLAPYALFGLIPIVGGLIAAWQLRLGKRHAFLAIVTVSAVLLFAPLAAYAGAFFNGFKPARFFAETTEAGRKDLDLQVYSWGADHLPSLNFYLRRDVRTLGSGDEVAYHLRSPIPAFIVMPESNAKQFRELHPSLGKEAGRHFDLYRGQPLVMLTNRP